MDVQQCNKKVCLKWALEVISLEPRHGFGRRKGYHNSSNKKQKSVQIVDDRPEIIEVHEKHGPLYKAIPKMPVPLAILCCILNIGLPGIGTLVSAFTVLCGAPTMLNKRVPAFLFNLLSAFLQLITFFVIVGWVWSILWGMNMVTLAMSWGEEKRTPYYCRRQSSIDVLD